MDGLLIDSERFIWYRAQKQTADEFNVELPDEFIFSMVGSNHDLYMKAIDDRFNKKVNSRDFQERIFQIVENICINEKLPLMPGVLDVLRFCKENNIKMSIGTSTIKRIASKALKNAGISEYFDYCVYGDEVRVCKPDPETYLKSVQHFNLKPDECIVFEDSPTGSKAAYAGGINLVYVQDLIEATENEEENAFKIIYRIDEIIPTLKEINNIK